MWTKRWNTCTCRTWPSAFWTSCLAASASAPTSPWCCARTPYILLDEPLNNLDMAHAVTMMKLLRRMVDERGKTVVVVLHDINFASCYADHIVAMKDGQLAYIGTPATVVRNEVLSALYGIPVSVHEIQGQRLCHYFA
jgi:iron complex transport system ATP-binding protein